MTEVTPAAPDAGAASPSIRDSLTAALKQAEAGELQVAEAQKLETVTGKAVASNGEATETPKTTDDRPRAPDGKFIAKDAADTSEKPTSEQLPAESKTIPKADTAPAITPPIEAPEHWSQTDKDMLAKQTPEAQKWLLDRHKAMEGDYTRKSQAVAPLLQSVEKVKPYLDSLGVTPEQAFNILVNAEYTLRHGSPDQKVQAIQNLLKDYDITLPNGTPQPTPASAADTSATDQSDGWVDPAVSAVRKELAEVKALLASREKADAAANQDRAIADIKAFEATKTEAGTPAHPYFADVAEDIIRLAHAERVAGRVPVLKDLYDAACKLNPAISAKREAERIAAERTKWEAESKAKEAEARAKADQARKAAASVSGAPRGGTAAAASGKTIRQMLESSLTESRGRL